MYSKNLDSFHQRERVSYILIVNELFYYIINVSFGEKESSFS